MLISVYIYRVTYVSIFPFLPAEISKNNISIIFYLKENFYFSWQKRKRQSLKVRQKYRKTQDLEGESELSQGFFFFYLNQTGCQTTSEGNLICEGTHPPDFRTFSLSNTGFKFEPSGSPLFHGPLSFSSGQARSCNQYASLSVWSERLSQQCCRDNVL